MRKQIFTFYLYKKIILFSATLFFVFLIFGCECVVKQDCNGVFNFVLKDTRGKDLLRGTNPTYHLDSIKIIAGTDTGQTECGIENLPSLPLACYLNGTSDTLFLHLNSIDTDTMLLSFRNHKRNLCCQSGWRSISGIIYNGSSSRLDSGIFVLVK
jgi:hypothetical protein